jgi:nucleotide-binding universal stress UspA family protein
MGKAIDQFTAACRAAGVPHQVRQETGNPFDLVASMARYHDLMVFGLHAIFEFGVVDEPHDELARLVTEGVRPILTVAENYRPIRRVLVAYSGSMESAKTMKRFVQMRLWPEVLLRIVTFEHPENAARQLLDDAAEYCRAHGYEAETEYVPGSPLRQLLEYAGQWDADLIVAGNSAKSLLRRRIFGETALELMRNSDRPLFLSQ